jgi:hypothetical protein
MTDTIIPAGPEWRVCVPETNTLFGMQRKPFVQIGIIAWAVSADGTTVTPITPAGRLDTSGEYVVVGPEPTPFLILPNGPFLHDYNELARMFKQTGAK